MNPLTNEILGQATHQEYETRYGHTYRGEPDQWSTPAGKQPALAWALSAASLVILIVSLIVYTTF